MDESNLFYVEAGGEERSERRGQGATEGGQDNNSIEKTTRTILKRDF